MFQPSQLTDAKRSCLLPQGLPLHMEELCAVSICLELSIQGLDPFQIFPRRLRGVSGSFEACIR